MTSQTKEEKGYKDGLCNRTACDNPNATWFNHSTQKWYCEECAIKINKHNKADSIKIYGHDLCEERIKNEL